MNKKTVKFSLLAFIISFFFVFNTLTIFAGIATGENTYYGPFSGVSYYNFSTVWTLDGTGARAMTSAFKDGSGVIPVGYAGAQARLYKDDTLYATTAMQYNSYEVAMVQAQTDWYTATGTYYSQGRSEAWHGSFYLTINAKRSPNQNY